MHYYKAQPLNLAWSATVAISSAAAVLFLRADVPPLVRGLVMLWFLLICPGMAFVQLLQINDALYEIVLALALSLVLDLLIASLILYAGIWSADLIFMILLALTSVGVLCQLLFWLNERAKQRLGPS